MKDPELFDLCETVYKVTGWDGDKQFAYDTTYADHWLRYIADFPDGTREKDLVDMVPMYTSDYLFTRLPRHLNLKKRVWHLLVMNGDAQETNWIADYVTTGRECWLHEGDQAQLTEADTPTKALLKLTIALLNAGELSHA